VRRTTDLLGHFRILAANGPCWDGGRGRRPLRNFSAARPKHDVSTMQEFAPRFAANYEKHDIGTAAFVRDAIAVFAERRCA